MPNLIYDIIQYEGPNETLVWKHNCTDFNAMTQLIVHESQEAIFFRNGQALDLFPAGRYTLESQNIPLLRRLINAPSGGKTPFHCEVYFINKAVSMDLPWGTNTPIPMEDPQYGITVQVRANGQMALAVQDSRKLLVKLVGTISVLARDEIARYFRTILMMYVKDIIANAMIQSRVSIREVNSRLIQLSNETKAQLVPVFEEYGLSLRHFNIGTISVPMDDPGYQQINEAIAKATARRVQGFSYQEERAYDVAQTAAGNEGIAGTAVGAQMGAAMGAGIGIPIGLNVGGMVSGVMPPVAQQVPSPVAAPSAVRCPACARSVAPDSVFCNQCGTRISPVAATCVSCKHEIPSGSVFCPRCGARQEALAEQEDRA